MENNDIKKSSELNEYFVDSYDDVNGCINLKNLEEYNINKIHDILNYIKNKIKPIYKYVKAGEEQYKDEGGMRFYFRLIEYKTYTDSKPEIFKQETKNLKIWNQIVVAILNDLLYLSHILRLVIKENFKIQWNMMLLLIMEKLLSIIRKKGQKKNIKPVFIVEFQNWNNSNYKN